MKEFTIYDCRFKHIKSLMNWTRYLLCVGALLLPLAARAQVGVVDHSWCIHRPCALYGVMQVTYPGPDNTYTFMYFGTTQFRVHAPLVWFAPVLLAPLAAAMLPVVWRRGARTKRGEG